MSEPLTLTAFLAGLQAALQAGEVVPFAPPAPGQARPPSNQSAMAALNQMVLDLTEQMVTALAEAIEARDTFTGGHCKRLAVACLAAGQRLGLDSERQHRLRLAAYLHDAGKISVPDAILKKPGPLSPEEYAEMQRHPSSGAMLLTRMPLLTDIAPIVAAHHERFDGRGYPHGLGGDAIPLEACVLSVADCYDALTQDRPYRKAQGLDQALSIIRGGRGTQFHPLAVDAFLEAVGDLISPPASERDEAAVSASPPPSAA